MNGGGKRLRLPPAPRRGVSHRAMKTPHVLLVALIAAAALVACNRGGAAESGTAPAEKAAAQAFMTKTAAEPGVQKLPSGVLYKVVRSGPAGGMKPKLSD